LIVVVGLVGEWIWVEAESVDGVVLKQVRKQQGFDW
jgi:hypothetical protein